MKWIRRIRRASSDAPRDTSPSRFLLQSDDRRGEDCSDRGHRSEYTRGGGTQRRFTFNVNFKGKDRIHVDRFNVCPGFPLPLSVARGRNPRWQNGKDDAIFRINTPWCTRLPSLPSLLSTAPRHCTLRFSLRVHVFHRSNLFKFHRCIYLLNRTTRLDCKNV